LPSILSPILILGLSVWGAWGVARRERSGAARLTMLGVMSFALAVLAAQSLGALAAIAGRPLLGPWSLVLAALVLACAIRVVAATRDRGGRARANENGVPPEGGARAATRRPAPACGDGPSTRTAALVGALGAASLLNGVILGLSGPPRGWDVLTYHLPRAVAWLQHGNLGHYGFSPAFYPGNGEVAMLITLFSGTDRLAPIVQLPFALLGAVALYGLAREIGARARSALLAFVAFAVTPIVVFQAGIAKNDLIVAGTVLAGSYLVIRALRLAAPSSGRRVALVAGGLAFGLALGTKYTILPFVLATLPVVLVASALTSGADGGTGSDDARGGSSRSGARWWPAIRETALFAAAVAVPAAFWFAQNWLVAGNPFAPVAVSVGNLVVFEGIDVAAEFGEQQFAYVSRPLGWLVFPWLDRVREGSYSSSVGSGAVFATFLIPAAAVLVRRALRGGSDRRPGPPVLLALVALGVVTWWFGGFHLPRYVWPALALFYAPMALVFDRVGGGARRVLVGVFVVAAAFSTLETARVIHGSDDFVASRFPRGMTRGEYYHMPDLVYELPAGTRILLLQTPGKAYHRTFRYPLIGGLPGNDVIMADDVGVDLADAIEDTALMHEALRRERVEYVFKRTLKSLPRPSVFDDFPNRYEKVLETIETPYRWHRSGIEIVLGGGRGAGTPAITTVYRVLGDRPTEAVSPGAPDDEPRGAVARRGPDDRPAGRSEPSDPGGASP
jgi:hypothetical protein